MNPVFEQMQPLHLQQALVQSPYSHQTMARRSGLHACTPPLTSTRTLERHESPCLMEEALTMTLWPLWQRKVRRVKRNRGCAVFSKR